MNKLKTKPRFKKAVLATFLLFALGFSLVVKAAAVRLRVSESRVIAGKVIDQNTGQGIAYTSVGIVGEVPGTVSGEDGKFAFTVPLSLQHKTVRFSVLGYQTRELPVAELLTIMATRKTIQIALIPVPVKLAEVKIKGKKWKTRTFGGNTGLGAFLHHNFIVDQLPLPENFGNEMGILINSGNRPTVIQELNFCLTANRFEMVKFRINVYALKDGLPFQNLASEGIYVTVLHKDEGWLTVDLKPYQLYVDHDFVITLEWIDCQPRKEGLFLTIAGAIPGLHTIYHKDTSQGNWRKLPPMGMGMNVVVQHEN